MFQIERALRTVHQIAIYMTISIFRFVHFEPRHHAEVDKREFVLRGIQLFIIQWSLRLFASLNTYVIRFHVAVDKSSCVYYAQRFKYLAKHVKRETGLVKISKPHKLVSAYELLQAFAAVLHLYFCYLICECETNDFWNAITELSGLLQLKKLSSNFIIFLFS